MDKLRLFCYKIFGCPCDNCKNGGPMYCNYGGMINKVCNRGWTCDRHIKKENK